MTRQWDTFGATDLDANKKASQAKMRKFRNRDDANADIPMSLPFNSGYIIAPDKVGGERRCYARHTLSGTDLVKFDIPFSCDVLTGTYLLANGDAPNAIVSSVEWKLTIPASGPLVDYIITVLDEEDIGNFTVTAPDVRTITFSSLITRGFTGQEVDIQVTISDNTGGGGVGFTKIFVPRGSFMAKGDAL